MFGDKYFSSTGTSCSRCTGVFSVFLVPLAFSLGLVAVTLLIGLILLFLPVFLVTLFPCILVQKIRQIGKSDHVIKIRDDLDNGDHNDAHHNHEEGIPLQSKEELEEAEEVVIIQHQPLINKREKKCSNIAEEP